MPRIDQQATVQWESLERNQSPYGRKGGLPYILGMVGKSEQEPSAGLSDYQAGSMRGDGEEDVCGTNAPVRLAHFPGKKS